MTQLTAAEILCAHSEHEVAEAKLQLSRDFFTARCYDTIIDLTEKVILRWWVKRMVPRDRPERDQAAMQERSIARANILTLCMSRIVERSGPIKPEALQVNVLGVSADVNALWGMLIEAGICTPQMRQDYLDASVMNTYQRVEDQAQKIQLAAASGGRRQ